MTGFDNIYRSQAMTQQTGAQYAQLAERADSQARQTVERAPAMAINAYESAMQAELVKRRTESDLRLQEAVIEDQFHKNKMNVMLMMNEVDMSQEQVRAARITNDNAERMAELERQKNEQRDRNSTNSIYAQIMPYLQSVGETWDPERGRRAMTPEEQANYEKSRRGRGIKTEQQIALDALAQFTKSYSSSSIPFDYNSLGPNEQAVYRDLFEQAYGRPHQDARDPGAALEDKYMRRGASGDMSRGNSGGGGASGQWQSPSSTATGTPDRAAVPPMVAQAQNLMRSDPSMQQMYASMTPEGQQQFAGVVGLAANKLVDAGLLTPEMGPRYIMSHIQQGGPSSAFYLLMGGMPESDVRDWLRTRPQLIDLPEDQQDKRIDFYINRLKQAAEQMGKDQPR